MRTGGFAGGFWAKAGNASTATKTAAKNDCERMANSSLPLH
jgi:hypothetical protein